MRRKDADRGLACSVQDPGASRARRLLPDPHRIHRWSVSSTKCVALPAFVTWIVDDRDRASIA